MSEKTPLNKENTSIRSLRESDFGRAAELWLACFPEDDRAFVDYYFAKRTRPERMLGLFETDDGRENLVSMLCFEKRRMAAKDPADPRRGSAEVCFIAGVCTAPEKRRRGCIRRLFAALESRMAGEGVGVFLLQPFDFGFYKKLGYKPFAKRRIVGVKNADTAMQPGFRPDEPAAERMLAAYDKAFSGVSGVLERSAERFAAIAEEYAMPGAKSAAVESETGCAYALWYGDELPLMDEFVFTDEAARTALEAAVFARAGAFSYPVPAESAEDGAYFNMIRITDERFAYLEKQAAPFGLTKY